MNEKGTVMKKLLIMSLFLFITPQIWASNKSDNSFNARGEKALKEVQSIINKSKAKNVTITDKELSVFIDSLGQISDQGLQGTLLEIFNVIIGLYREAVVMDQNSMNDPTKLSSGNFSYTFSNKIVALVKTLQKKK